MGPAARVLGAIGFVINLIAPDLILPKPPCS
jgi:preprotein translocase subunit Sss1